MTRQQEKPREQISASLILASCDMRCYIFVSLN
ncbi:hypothetical protein OIU76_015293, partial [Salix suchowensis]